ncbi:hypothetical protein AB4582_06730 [Vibrio splendidus]
MTTTTFRINGDRVMMAADSRVSYIDAKSGQLQSWKDYDDYLKAIECDGKLYGFAGSNRFFLLFLLNLQQKKYTDVQILHALAGMAKKEKDSFLIMRYDTELHCFGYLSDSDSLYDINSAALETDKYAIGTGAYTPTYKRHQTNISAMFPIKQIIVVNEKAVAKAEKKAKGQPIDHPFICLKAGGDHGTGGEIKMTTLQTESNVVQAQINVLKRISSEANASRAVAVCSFDSQVEREKLENLGVKPNKTEQVLSKEEEELMDGFYAQIASIEESFNEEFEDEKVAI